MWCASLWMAIDIFLCAIFLVLAKYKKKEIHIETTLRSDEKKGHSHAECNHLKFHCTYKTHCHRPGHPLICSHAIHPKTLQQRIIKLYDGWVLIINDFSVLFFFQSHSSSLHTYAHAHNCIRHKSKKKNLCYVLKVPISFFKQKPKRLSHRFFSVETFQTNVEEGSVRERKKMIVMTLLNWIFYGFDCMFPCIYIYSGHHFSVIEPRVFVYICMCVSYVIAEALVTQ